MKKVIWIIIVLIVIGATIFKFIHKNTTESKAQFEYTKIKYGDIENLVSCTGTLEAVGTVEVGTELSGTVNKVYVDYNDNVKRNQILAILDTTQLAINLRSAKADLIRAKAQYELSKKEYENDQTLFGKNFISELDLKTAETAMKTNYVSLLSAQANLDKAELNINKYSIIRSPIDGKVIDRSIEEGQTVAASFSSPTLFYIAQNLSQMEIYAYVDESDIGKIFSGMKAVFTVEAYPDKEFAGTVKQIRLQPETVSNVVTYTVVVEAENRDNLLLPGMTAIIDFIIEQKKDVIIVSNSALTFTPDFSLIQQKKRKRKEERNKNRSQENNTKPLPPADSKNLQKMRDASKLWYLDENNNLQMTIVETESTDGINTELISYGNLKVGNQVIVKQTNSSSLKKTASEQRRPMMRPF
jgi:HlyD family secretion protein